MMVVAIMTVYYNSIYILVHIYIYTLYYSIFNIYTESSYYVACWGFSPLRPAVGTLNWTSSGGLGAADALKSNAADWGMGGCYILYNIIFQMTYIDGYTYTYGSTQITGNSTMVIYILSINALIH